MFFQYLLIFICRNVVALKPFQVEPLGFMLYFIIFVCEHLFLTLLLYLAGYNTVCVGSYSWLEFSFAYKQAAACVVLYEVQKYTCYCRSFKRTPLFSVHWNVKIKKEKLWLCGGLRCVRLFLCINDNKLDLTVNYSERFLSRPFLFGVKAKLSSANGVLASLSYLKYRHDSGISSSSGENDVKLEGRTENCKRCHRHKVCVFYSLWFWGQTPFLETVSQCVTVFIRPNFLWSGIRLNDKKKSLNHNGILKINHNKSSLPAVFSDCLLVFLSRCSFVVWLPSWVRVKVTMATRPQCIAPKSRFGPSERLITMLRLVAQCLYSITHAETSCTNLMSRSEVFVKSLSFFCCRLWPFI